jgi:hypothetical protein
MLTQLPDHQREIREIASRDAVLGAQVVHSRRTMVCVAPHDPVGCQLRCSSYPLDEAGVMVRILAEAMVAAAACGELA